MKCMVRFITFSFVLYSYCRKTNGAPLGNLADDPDMYRNVSEIITSNGYPLEEHYVQTQDGYLLSIQRISHGRKCNFKVNKKGVVLLIHGILADSATWVLKSPDQSLGFVLPDEGYDAWFLNTRGTTYSKKHIKYKTNEYKFWDFSFDEVAQYDLPTTIDYILKDTGEKDLYLIGHSQGSTAAFGMLSEMPDYNKKVKLFIAIAPVTSIGYSTSVAARSLLPFADTIAFTINLITSGEFSLNNKFIRTMAKILCTGNDEEFCKDFILALEGEDESKLNKTGFPVNAALYLSSTSTKSFVHYAQLAKSKKFRKYDYGSRNMKYYQQEEPPDYDLSRITTSVALIWSTNDIYADPKDVDILRRKLKSLVFDYCVPQPYNHTDFFQAEDVQKSINEPILKLLLQY